MATDPELTEHMRQALQDHEGLSEKKIFGGICFFLHGNMICGAHREMGRQGLFMFRVGKHNADQAVKLGAKAPLMLGDQIMPGFYFVDSGCSAKRFADWLALALSHARSLPTK